MKLLSIFALLFFLHVKLLIASEAINLRVIDGVSVTSESKKWEWILSLRQDDHHICGASLIAPTWVVTASHCISSYDRVTHASRVSVMSGSYDVTSVETIIAAKRILKHPAYDEYTVDNDIALIELESAIEDITPIALDRNSGLADGDESWIAGWGNISTTGWNYPDALKEVDLRIIDFEVCNENYTSEGTPLTDNMFCSGYMDGSKDSCQGDSGGPLIVPDALSYKLAGIVSFGGSLTQSCGAPDYPGVYTKVQNYIDWIESYTGVLNKNYETAQSITLEDVLIYNTPYEIDGFFGHYKFEGVSDSAFEWAYQSASGQYFQFQGVPSSSKNVFGWKAIDEAIEMEASWYMINLGEDTDGDGSLMFDWLLVGAHSDSVYKLKGVKEDGTFEYSQPLDINYSVDVDTVSFYK
jgi:hypothetical protein